MRWVCFSWHRAKLTAPLLWLYVGIGGSTYWTWEELSLTPDDTTVVKCVTETCGGLHCSHIHRPYSCQITSCVDQSFMYFLKLRSGDLPQRSPLLVWVNPTVSISTQPYHTGLCSSQVTHSLTDSLTDSHTHSVTLIL